MAARLVHSSRADYISQTFLHTETRQCKVDRATSGGQCAYPRLPAYYSVRQRSFEHIRMSTAANEFLRSVAEYELSKKRKSRTLTDV